MSDYSALDRILHKVALGAPAVAEMIHDIERGMYLKSAPDISHGRHVFVTGLARAGTTILMREIHASGQFGSLTYADMPFVLAPNFWKKISGKNKKTAMAERAHGDGILVNTDSPEALEEVFWRVNIGKSYIQTDGLRPHDVDTETLDAFSDYMRLILRKTGHTRYLSKNNNAILRLGSMLRAFEDSHFLLPIRDPIQHAMSLQSQHLRFKDTDRFTADYMRWLAHHEFGATQRPFLFGGNELNGTPDDLDYWLGMWIGAYTHLSSVAAGAPHAQFVPFEALSRQENIWPAIAGKIGIEGARQTELRAIADREPPPHDHALAATARQLYDRICAQAMPALDV